MTPHSRTGIVCPDEWPEPRIERRPRHRMERRLAFPVTGPPLDCRASSPHVVNEALSALEVAGSLRRSDPATHVLSRIGKYVRTNF